MCYLIDNIKRNFAELALHKDLQDEWSCGTRRRRIFLQIIGWNTLVMSKIDFKMKKNQLQGNINFNMKKLI